MSIPEEKLTPEEIEQYLDDIFNPYIEWYQIEPRLAEYETFALNVIKFSGYSSVAELKKAISESQEITDTAREAHRIFYSVSSVRHNIKKGNPENVALEMMRLCNNAFRLNFTIIEPSLTKWQEQIRYASEGGKTRATPKETLEVWQKEAARLKKKGLSKRAIAEIIAKDTGKPAETIRKKI